jgi:hypothetical protein
MRLMGAPPSRLRLPLIEGGLVVDAEVRLADAGAEAEMHSAALALHNLQSAIASNPAAAPQLVGHIIAGFQAVPPANCSGLTGALKAGSWLPEEAAGAVEKLMAETYGNRDQVPGQPGQVSGQGPVVNAAQLAFGMYQQFGRMATRLWVLPAINKHSDDPASLQQYFGGHAEVLGAARMVPDPAPVLPYWAAAKRRRVVQGGL